MRRVQIKNTILLSIISISTLFNFLSSPANAQGRFCQDTNADADIVIMVDLTGSNTAANITEQKNAVLNFIDSFNAPGVTTKPYIAVGSFNHDCKIDGNGDLICNGNAARMLTNGNLTNSYGAIGGAPDLVDAVNNVTGAGLFGRGLGGTNIAAALAVAKQELDTNGSPLRPNYVVLISDGNPNLPGFATNPACTSCDCITAEDAGDAQTELLEGLAGTDSQIFAVHYKGTGVSCVDEGGETAGAIYMRNEIASKPEFFYNALANIVNIFKEIAQDISCQGSGPACSISFCDTAQAPPLCSSIPDTTDTDADGVPDCTDACPGADDTQLGTSCSAGVGVCQQSGTKVCSAGTLVCNATPGAPSAEICDGLDNDCDGAVDNSPTDPSIGTSCSAGVGQCQQNGTNVCLAGAIQCNATAGTPSAEICDGLDNDCNGQIDDAPTDPTIGTNCSAGVGQCQTPGTNVCLAGSIQCNAAPGAPSAEICDGLDNDCDGAVDNSPTDPSIGTSCSAGVGQCQQNGTNVCLAGAIQCNATAGTPAAEICDGLDNDCDGQTDDAPTDPTIGTNCSAGVGQCQTPGTNICLAGSIQCNAAPGAPSAEICDGLDNDCNGTIDDSPTDRSIGTNCSAGTGQCLQTGTNVCTGGTIQCTAAPGSPSAEICDGLDNNCNGSIDDSPSDPSLGTSCTAGTGQCQASGSNVCQNGSVQCTAAPGAPSAELCDGLDNNCDGSVDNNPVDPSIGTACSAGVGACQRSGSNVCVSGSISCNAAAAAPGIEICDGADNNCNGVADEGTVCCTSNDLSDVSLSLDSQAAAQLRLIKKLARNLSNVAGKNNKKQQSYIQSALVEAQKLYNESWGTSWAIPQNITTCSSISAECVTSLSYSNEISVYKANSQRLFEITQETLKRLIKLRGRKKSDTVADKQSQAQLAEANAQISKVPAAGNLCN